MTTPTRIGLIGCGGIAEWHVKGYLQRPQEARITAVSDVVEANAQRVSQDVGGAQAFSDFHDLLAQSDVDAVDICLPHHLHKEAIVAAAQAGKHILCEKPLCLSMEEANEITAALAKHSVTLMCAHNQLFYAPIQKARAMIAENALGRLFEVRTTDTYRMPHSTPLGWRAKRATMGGGELIDTGYHPSYMLLYLTGSELAEVTAVMGKFWLPTMEGEDTAHVLVRFTNGTLGTIVTSWAYDFLRENWKFHVIGERGQLLGNEHTLVCYLDGQEPQTLTFPEIRPTDTYALEVIYFVACLREKRTPIQTEVDGIRVLQMILAAYQSQEQKRTVELTKGE